MIQFYFGLNCRNRGWQVVVDNCEDLLSLIMPQPPTYLTIWQMTKCASGACHFVLIALQFLTLNYLFQVGTHFVQSFLLQGMLTIFFLFLNLRWSGSWVHIVVTPETSSCPKRFICFGVFFSCCDCHDCFRKEGKTTRTSSGFIFLIH